MSIFRRVVETGSFSAIAREIGTSQPTVSKYVASLEQRLGIKLLNRSTRQLNLTEAGQEYYKHCIRILDDVAESEASIGRGQSRPTGTLRITAPVMFGRLFVAPILWEFLELYPELNIDLLLNDQNVDLIKEGVDVAIRAGSLSDSSLVARKIGTCPPQTLVASPSYLAKRGVPKTLVDLKSHDCLLHSLATSSNEWDFIGPKGRESVRVNSRFVSNNRDTINAAALASVGVAITWLWPNSAHFKHGRLERLLTDYAPMSMEVFAVYPERRYVPQKVHSFIEYVASSFESPEKFQSLVERTA